VSFAALAAVVAWGASFVATRMALVAVRFTVGGAALAIYGRLKGKPVLPPGGGRRAMTVLGMVLAAHLLIQAIGLRFTSAISSSWIVGFIPVTIALGGWLFLGQRLRPLAWLGVALGTGGLALVTGLPPEGFASARLGDLLQVVSCLTWTAYTLLAVRPVARHGSLVATAAPMLVAAAVTAVATAIEGRPVVGPPTLAALAAVAFLAVVCSAVSYLLWFSALEELGPARTSVYIYLEPFVTLALAASVLDEPVTWAALAGGCAVLAGVFLVQRGGPR